MVFLKQKFKRFMYRQTVRSLRNISSETVISQSQQKAVDAFNEASLHSKYYKSILNNLGVKNLHVENIKSFHDQVPILDKQIIYKNNPIESELFPFDGSRILLSSGISGSFSFGIQTREQLEQDAQFLNILLDAYFHILDKKTLIINCLTVVNLPQLDASIVKIGPREDALHYLLKTLSPNFEQTIIIGDNYFIKNALEDGAALGINYTKLSVHLILGGIYLPENLREHLTVILKNNSADYDLKIFSSMGISEFGVNIFFETDETVKLRKLMKSDSKLREQLLGNDWPNYLPMFFNYFPQNFYIESIDQNLILTSLNRKASLPLIRYKSSDKVKFIFYDELKSILSRSISDCRSLLPPFKSPLVLIYGKDESLQIKGQNIYPHQVQMGLYEDFSTAEKTTGYFRLNAVKEAIEIQLKKGVNLTEAIHHQIQESAVKYLPIDLPVHVYTYQTFPYGMELDYERKFKYV